MKLKEEYFMKYGWTEGCEVCRAKQQGRPRTEQREHKEACRKRIREAMEQDEEGRRILEKDRQRVNRRLAEEVEARATAQQQHSGINPTGSKGRGNRRPGRRQDDGGGRTMGGGGSGP